MLKKKVFTRLVALLICFTTLLPFAGCKKDDLKGPKPSPDNLAIEVYGGGYGTDWLYSVAREYTNKFGIEVAITVQTGNQGISNMQTSFNSGIAETDIYFTEGSIFNQIYEGKKKFNGVEYETPFVELSDVYNATVDGVLYKDKMVDAYEELYNVDGKYYCTGWVDGLLGLVVNMDVWTGADFTSFPRTTDELFEYADALKGKKINNINIAPFIYSLNDEYWTCYSPIFMAQYEGLERMKAIYAGYDSEGNRYTNAMADFDGYLETLRLYDRLLKKDNGYMHSVSQDVDFTNMQGMFLQGYAAMCPNGDWIEKEMYTNYQDANIAFMKTPIISALAKKLSFASASDKDAKLRQLVDYVDANASGYANKPTWATNEDIDTVRGARNIEMTESSRAIGYIPAYSNQVKAAKDFLVYLASDEAMAIYRQATGGCAMPFNWVNEPTGVQYSSLRQSVINVTSKATMLLPNMKDRIFALGNINYYFFNNENGRYVAKFAALEAKDYISPENYYNAEQLFFINNIEALKKAARV